MYLLRAARTWAIDAIGRIQALELGEQLVEAGRRRLRLVVPALVATQIHARRCRCINGTEVRWQTDKVNFKLRFEFLRNL